VATLLIRHFSAIPICRHTDVARATRYRLTDEANGLTPAPDPIAPDFCGGR